MIIITGDSWGVGEFSQNALIVGPGIGSYVTKFEPSTNLSQGASSNSQALDRLEYFLNRYTPVNEDIFIWIVSGPNRCIENLDNFLTSVQTIKSGLRNILSSSLERANDLAKKHNISIRLVGGLCDLTEVYSEYSNLEIVVPSWGLLLNEKYNHSIVEPAFIKDIFTKIKQSYPHFLDEWVALATLAANKTRSWDGMKTTYFKSDNCHPDRSGHMFLLRTLFPEWDEVFKHYETELGKHKIVNQ